MNGISGWLERHDRSVFLGSNWKRAFWILDISNQNLEVFQKAEGGGDSQLKIAPLEIKWVEKRENNPLKFVIHLSDGKDIILKAETEAVRNEWLDKLDDFLAQAEGFAKVNDEERKLLSKEHTAKQLAANDAFVGKARHFALSTSKGFFQDMPNEKKRLNVPPNQETKEEVVDESLFIKTPSQKEFLLKGIQEIIDMYSVKEADAESIVDRMFRVEFSDEFVIIQQGGPMETFFWIESGSVGIYTQETPESSWELEEEKKSGNSFGVLSLVYNQPSEISVKTHSACVMWALSSRHYHLLTKNEAKLKQNKKLKLLFHVPLIHDNVDFAHVTQMADSFTYQEYKRGDVIVKQGEELKHVFVVAEGIATLSNGDEGETQGQLMDGDVFGEWALLQIGSTSDFTIVAESDKLVLLVLECEEVELAVGPLRSIVLQKWLEIHHISAESEQEEETVFQHEADLGKPMLMAHTKQPHRVENSRSSKFSRSSHSSKFSRNSRSDKFNSDKFSQHALLGQSLSVNKSLINSGQKLLRSAQLLTESSSSKFGSDKSLKNMHEQVNRALPIELQDQVLKEVSANLRRRESQMRDEHMMSKNSPQHGEEEVKVEIMGSVPEGVADSEDDDEDKDGTMVWDDKEEDGEHNLDKPFVHTHPMRPELQMDRLTFCALLGRGSFGRVHLAKNVKDASELFAVKVLTRHTITLNGWETMVENEIAAMLELSGQTQSFFLLRILNVFTDSKNVYLVLALCPGGDLFCLMSSFPNGRFVETDARFYFACVIMGLDAMQQRDIAYRDLKPENLMISKTGYVKIADFGLAKKTLRTFTVCGTPEYMAPEILLSKGHGVSADWWAAGIVLHEILCGETPFAGGDCMEVYEKILSHERVDDLVYNYDFGEVLSSHAKDMIEQLLHPKKNMRLGMKFPGVAGAKDHAFFDSVQFDWESLESLEMPAPVLPNISQVEMLATNQASIDRYDPKLLSAPDDNSGWTIKI